MIFIFIGQFFAILNLVHRPGPWKALGVEQKAVPGRKTGGNRRRYRRSPRGQRQAEMVAAHDVDARPRLQKLKQKWLPPATPETRIKRPGVPFAFNAYVKRDLTHNRLDNPVNKKPAMSLWTRLWKGENALF